MESFLVRVLVTGASGFLGSALLQQLNQRGLEAIGLYRSDPVGNKFIVDSLDTLESDQLIGIDCIVHCAARAHVMSEDLSNPLAEYRKVNVEGTLRLARQAFEAGVKRFIFISSIKVNGEQTSSGSPYTADNIPKPLDAYGISKYEAEEGLRDLALNTGMELVIIRPPLIYGPGMKGNLAAIKNLVDKSFPLPFAGIKNKRSLVGLDNLVDFIALCVTHPGAKNQTFLVSDNEDISTTQLFQFAAEARGKSLVIFKMPFFLMKFSLRLLGKTDLFERLFGSLQVDITKTQFLLNWQPRIGVKEGFRRAFKK
jgi:nucleoside-diphosphate-sugar epimerase